MEYKKNRYGGRDVVIGQTVVGYTRPIKLTDYWAPYYLLTEGANTVNKRIIGSYESEKLAMQAVEDALTAKRE